MAVHSDLHSAQGPRPGEHLGRSTNPVIKVADLAWLEFAKPDLARTEAFAHAFGFATALRTDTELQLRGTDPGAPCVIIRRGGTRFTGMAFTAVEDADLLRLADAAGSRVRPLPESIGGSAVDLVDPGGLPVRVVSGTHPLAPLPALSSSVNALPTLLALAEPGNVMFGSDWPFAPIAAGRLFAAGLETYGGLDEIGRDAIDRTNALALFPRLGSAPEPIRKPLVQLLQHAAGRRVMRSLSRMIGRG